MEVNAKSKKILCQEALAVTLPLHNTIDIGDNYCTRVSTVSISPGENCLAYVIIAELAL